MKINYLFGNGLSIFLDDKYMYKNLLSGFVETLKVEYSILPKEIEMNPESFFAKWVKILSDRNCDKHWRIFMHVQDKLRKYIIEKIKSSDGITHKKYLLKEMGEVFTTNYDLNIENNIINSGSVHHLHGKINDPNSIIFAIAEAKDLIVDLNKISAISGTIVLFGLKPGFDFHIFDALFNNKKILKIEIAYYNDEDKRLALSLVDKCPCELIIISHKEFLSKYLENAIN